MKKAISTLSFIIFSICLISSLYAESTISKQDIELVEIWTLERDRSEQILHQKFLRGASVKTDAVYARELASFIEADLGICDLFKVSAREMREKCRLLGISTKSAEEIPVHIFYKHTSDINPENFFANQTFHVVKGR
jgi:hypothetical protein